MCPSPFAGGRRPQRVGHAAEVVAEDGEFDGVRELARTPDEGAQKQPPISHASPVPDTQHPEGFQEGNAIRPRQVQSRTGRTMALEERPDALVVVPRLVKLLHQFAVAGLQEFTVQFGFEVQRGVGVVAGAFDFQPSLTLQPLPQSRLRQRVQQSHHCRRHAGALDKFKLPLEDVALVAVKTHDESAHDFQPGALQRLHRGHEVAIPVLKFVTFLQRLDRGRFDAHENLFETGLDHQRAQFRVIGEIHGRLGEKTDTGPRAPPPFDQRVQQCLGLLFVADEIVVHDENHVFPPVPGQRVQLGNQLRRRFRAGHAPVHHDDVANFDIT